MNVIETHIENVLIEYTQGEYYQHLLAAKEKYFQMTGKLNEDAPEFESRMSTFNDWYVFNYEIDGTRVIDKYVESKNLDEEIGSALKNANYSLFHFVKINWKKQTVLKDILHSKKIIMGQDNGSLSLLPDDLFIGRTIDFQGQSYLLHGICALPRDVLGILKKKSKVVRKENNLTSEQTFLLSLENLKTKSLNYSHIPAERIFSEAH